MVMVMDILMIIMIMVAENGSQDEAACNYQISIKWVYYFQKESLQIWKGSGKDFAKIGKICLIQGTVSSSRKKYSDTNKSPQDDL